MTTSSGPGASAIRTSLNPGQHDPPDQAVRRLLPALGERRLDLAVARGAEQPLIVEQRDERREATFGGAGIGVADGQMHRCGRRGWP
jgi:hypothetical protein